MSRWPSSATLPSELFDIIIANVSLGPRVRVLSLVCKRWRGSVYRNITELRQSRSSAVGLDAVLPRLPALHTLHLTSNLRAPSPQFPTNLRSLHLPEFMTMCLARDRIHFPHLTDLSIYCVCTCLSTLVAVVATSLTSLSIDVSSASSRVHVVALAKTLSHAPLTSLRALRLVMKGDVRSWIVSSFNMLLTRTSSQLERLTLVDYSASAQRADRFRLPDVMPELHTLHLEVSNSYHDDLAALINSCPTLGSLSLVLVNLAPHIGPVLLNAAGVLKSLQEWQYTRQHRDIPFAALTNLTHLDLPAGYAAHGADAPWVPLLPHLRSLAINADAEDLALLCGNTVLRTLVLRRHPMYEVDLVLPNLRVLEISHDKSTTQKHEQAIRRFFRNSLIASPNLREVRWVDSSFAPKQVSRNVVLEILREAEQRGVELFDLGLWQGETVVHSAWMAVRRLSLPKKHTSE